MKLDFDHILSQKEIEFHKSLKTHERDKKKLVRDFDLLKAQLREKENGVKSEIEKVWTEWEERCAELEAENKALDFKLHQLDHQCADLQKAAAHAKKEAKALKTKVDDRAHEIKVLQTKYEQELQQRADEVEELQKKAAKDKEYLQFEVQHLKAELEKQYKKEYQLRQQTKEESPLLSRVGQQPFQSGKQPSLNDSLDAMRREFYLQFNNLMGDSLGARESPLARVSRVSVQDKELLVRELQLENEELKRIVEQMKNDMELVMLEVKQGKPDVPQVAVQQEIIQKERRIFELERKVKAKDDEIEKLKAERDRLVSISNDLRAELNNALRQLQTLHEGSEPHYEVVEDYNENRN